MCHHLLGVCGVCPCVVLCDKRVHGACPLHVAACDRRVPSSYRHGGGCGRCAGSTYSSWGRSCASTPGCPPPPSPRSTASSSPPTSTPVPHADPPDAWVLALTPPCLLLTCGWGQGGGTHGCSRGRGAPEGVWHPVMVCHLVTLSSNGALSPGDALSHEEDLLPRGPHHLGVSPPLGTIPHPRGAPRHWGCPNPVLSGIKVFWGMVCPWASSRREQRRGGGTG